MLISHVIADNDAALLFCRQWHHKNAKDAMAIRKQIHMYVYVCVEKDHRMEGMKRKCVASASAAISQRKYQMGGVSCHRIHSHYPLSTLFPLSATYACIHTYVHTWSWWLHKRSKITTQLNDVVTCKSFNKLISSSSFFPTSYHANFLYMLLLLPHMY